MDLFIPFTLLSNYLLFVTFMLCISTLYLTATRHLAIAQVDTSDAALSSSDVQVLYILYTVENALATHCNFVNIITILRKLTVSFIPHFCICTKLPLTHTHSWARQQVS